MRLSGTSGCTNGPCRFYPRAVRCSGGCVGITATTWCPRSTSRKPGSCIPEGGAQTRPLMPTTSMFFYCPTSQRQARGFGRIQGFFLDIVKKTQAQKNSKLKQNLKKLKQNPEKTQKPPTPVEFRLWNSFTKP